VETFSNPFVLERTTLAVQLDKVTWAMWFGSCTPNLKRKENSILVGNRISIVASVPLEKGRLFPFSPKEILFDSTEFRFVSVFS
jgi:hypothetical protein